MPVPRATKPGTRHGRQIASVARLRQNRWPRNNRSGRSVGVGNVMSWSKKAEPDDATDTVAQQNMLR
jgi:hypothetical protein